MANEFNSESLYSDQVFICFGNHKEDIQVVNNIT